VEKVNFGLSCYSFPFSCGFLKRDGVSACPKPMNGLDLVDLAAQHGMGSVEFPHNIIPDHSEAGLDRFNELLKSKGMTYVLDMGIINVEEMQRVLPLGKRAGARIVRCTITGFLEGARAKMVPDWDAYMRDMISRVVAVRPLLDELDMVLAIENHQDATSGDLLALCTAGGPRVGATLDVVNPLAVAEEPYEFAERLGDRIFNIHIKDYTVHRTESGYNLARAGIGEGCIDWRRMLSLIKGVSPAAMWHVELAALNARHIRLYEDQWWRGYPPRDVRDMLSLFRFVAHHTQPDNAPSQTPWECDAPAGECENYERGQMDRTVAYLKNELSDLVMSK
jgi:sugar phosphate isomerase/epimerase